MNRPYYTKNPIGSIDSLAKHLSENSDRLISIARSADSFYSLYERIQKADGSFREVYCVVDELKGIQRKIHDRLFDNVYYPDYLYATPNGDDHIDAASIHKNASIVVRMDISNFYPSLKSKIILKIWKRLFKFPVSVASLLTELTTFNGALAQGAPTSPGLANLVFWDKEYIIVDKLQRNGFRYTRYVDDVTVSSENFTKMHTLSPVFADVFGMFRSKGAKPNRSKIDISTSGHPMSVHNLNVNSGKPTINKHEKGRIRTAVWQCETKYPQHSREQKYRELWNSTFGRVNYLNQLHPNIAYDLFKRLEDVKPQS